MSKNPKRNRDEVFTRSFFQECGRKGGAKSRRELSSDDARELQLRSAAARSRNAAIRNSK